jgi:hypothetical protein
LSPVCASLAAESGGEMSIGGLRRPVQIQPGEAAAIPPAPKIEGRPPPREWEPPPLQKLVSCYRYKTTVFFVCLP